MTQLNRLQRLPTLSAPNEWSFYVLITILDLNSRRLVPPSLDGQAVPLYVFLNLYGVFNIIFCASFFLRNGSN
jgi:hypothetical protein